MVKKKSTPLTDTKVKKASPGDYPDAACPGLRLVVGKTMKSWVYRFRSKSEYVTDKQGRKMGRLKQNSYCTSCGNCSQSCPHTNIAWRFRSPSVEAVHGARPHWDEAWFMLGLLALTAFHGLTMMPFWEVWMSQLARFIGDSGRLLWSFSIGLVACLAVVAAVYTLLVAMTRRWTGSDLPFRRLFSVFGFVALPLAFAYHMAHNLNHLLRESAGLGDILMNPLGTGTLPLSMAEKHARHLDMWLSADVLFALQAAGIVTKSFSDHCSSLFSLTFFWMNRKNQKLRIVLTAL